MSRARHRVAEGTPFQLGAKADGKGVNFALFSGNATRVEVCLFEPDGKRETARILLPEYTDEIWHGYVPGLTPGQLYGYRVHGPYAPAEGHRFNPHKLLIDPYATLLDGEFAWNAAHLGYVPGEDDDDTPSETDSAAFMPKCVVAMPRSRWRERLSILRKKREPRPWPETIIYEAHVKGLTQLHPDIPKKKRGTFAGLANPAVIDHLVSLGVSAIELLGLQPHRLLRTRAPLSFRSRRRRNTRRRRASP
jgi:isoamylase